jgi:acyl-ACP thioesterase
VPYFFLFVPNGGIFLDNTDKNANFRPMENNDFILHENYTMASRDADFNGKLRVSSLINFFIQAAWQSAEELGFGYRQLSVQKLGWVLSRFKIKINELPIWPGELSVTTWPKGLNRLFYMRDAEFSDAAQNKIAAITSAWLVFDINSKRPKLLNTEVPALFQHKDKHAIDEGLPVLKFEGEPVTSTSYTVRYNDIDINQHLTTVRYIDFIFDTYDIAFHTHHSPKEITVNFLKEITFGTEVIMHRYVNKNVHGFELVNTLDSTVCFRAQVVY